MIADAEKSGVSQDQQATAAATESEEETLTDILPGFPEKVEGEIVFCSEDNINTDGIYPVGP
jgi:homoaconitate hydratase